LKKNVFNEREEYKKEHGEHINYSYLCVLSCDAV